MASVNRTRPHCVNQMGKTHSKPLVTRHGHGMLCESALTHPRQEPSELHSELRRGRLSLKNQVFWHVFLPMFRRIVLPSTPRTT